MGKKTLSDTTSTNAIETATQTTAEVVELSSQLPKFMRDFGKKLTDKEKEIAQRFLNAGKEVEVAPLSLGCEFITHQLKETLAIPTIGSTVGDALALNYQVERVKANPELATKMKRLKTARVQDVDVYELPKKDTAAKKKTSKKKFTAAVAKGTNARKRNRVQDWIETQYELGVRLVARLKKLKDTEKAGGLSTEAEGMLKSKINTCSSDINKLIKLHRNATQFVQRAFAINETDTLGVAIYSTKEPTSENAYQLPVWNEDNTATGKLPMWNSGEYVDMDQSRVIKLYNVLVTKDKKTGAPIYNHGGETPVTLEDFLKLHLDAIPEGAAINVANLWKTKDGPAKEDGTEEETGEDITDPKTAANMLSQVTEYCVLENFGKAINAKYVNGTDMAQYLDLATSTDDMVASYRLYDYLRVFYTCAEIGGKRRERAELAIKAFLEAEKRGDEAAEEHGSDSDAATEANKKKLTA